MFHFVSQSGYSIRKTAVNLIFTFVFMFFVLSVHQSTEGVAVNDNLADAVAITTFPFSETVDNTGGTVEISEMGNINYSFWYTITPATDSALRVTAVNDVVNPIVGLFVGTVHPLSYPGTNGDANSSLDNVGQWSENFVWGVTAGTTYYIRIASSSAGPIQVMIDNPALASDVPDDLADAIEITDILNEYVDMANATLALNENACGGIDRSIWYTVTPDDDSLLVVLEDGEQDDHALGLYTGSSFPQTAIYCSDSDNRGGDSEGYVQQLTAGTTYYIKVGSRNIDIDPSVLNVRIAVMPSGTLNNDNLANAKEVTADAFTESIDNTGSGLETGETGGSGDDHSIWYSMAPGSNSTVTITAVALDHLIDPTIGIYTGTSHPLTEVAFQDFDNLFSNDGSSYGGGEEVTVNLNAGTSYYVRIASKTEGPVGVAIVGMDGEEAPSTPSDSDPGCFIDTLVY